MLEILITIGCGLILFIAFILLRTMPAIESHPKATTYEGYFMEVSERIASIKDHKHISAAELARLEFKSKFNSYPQVRRDCDVLQLQIDGKKRRFGGVWL